MKLQSQDAMVALDADFGQMAIHVGSHAWGLPQLNMREKAFVFVAADLCSHNLGMAFETHVRMAMANGVPLGDVRESVRHLAPYAGYPTAAEALFRLASIEEPAAGPGTVAGTAANPMTRPAVELPASTLAELTELDPAFAEFYKYQFDDRWSRGALTLRERALATIAVDVLFETLDEPFRLHIGIARVAGATEEQIRGVLHLVAEYGIGKTWRALAALVTHLG